MNKSTKQYLDTYFGDRLLNEHTLDTYGIWHVHGEDPNCDMGGHHYQPDMGIYEGTLESVLDQVTVQKQFWTWGAGGTLKLVTIKPALTVEQVAEQQQSDLELMAELRALQAKAVARGLTL